MLQEKILNLFIFSFGDKNYSCTSFYYCKYDFCLLLQVLICGVLITKTLILLEFLFDKELFRKEFKFLVVEVTVLYFCH